MARAGPTNVHRYSLEFKVKAVKLSQLTAVEVQAVADALDIHPFMLSRWRKEARDGVLRGRTPGSAVRKPPSARNLGWFQALHPKLVKTWWQSPPKSSARQDFRPRNTTRCRFSTWTCCQASRQACESLFGATFRRVLQF